MTLHDRKFIVKNKVLSIYSKKIDFYVRINIYDKLRGPTTMRSIYNIMYTINNNLNDEKGLINERKTVIIL